MGHRRLVRPPLPVVPLGDDGDQHGKPLYEAIVLRAREEGIAGVTVVPCIEGYGATSHLRTTRLLELSSDLPVVIEIVDHADRIESFMPKLDEMVDDGLVTTERVHIATYRGSEANE
jgi:PII-like signaling protein